MSQAERPLGSPGHLPRGWALRHSDHSWGTRERTQNRHLLSYYYLFKHSQRNFQRHFPPSTISPVFGIQNGVRMLSQNPLEFIIFRIKWWKSLSMPADSARSMCKWRLTDSACIPISRLPWRRVKIDVALQIRQGARPHDDAFLWAQLPLLCQSWCFMEHLQETAPFLPNMRGFLWLSCQIFLPMTQPHPSCKIVSCFLLNHG